MENTHSLSLLFHSVELRCCSDINSPMRIESVEYYLILGIRINTCFTGSFFIIPLCIYYSTGCLHKQLYAGDVQALMGSEDFLFWSCTQPFVSRYA